MLTKDLDVFAATETWLTPDVQDNFTAIEAYSFIRNDRGLLCNPKVSEQIVIKKRKKNYTRKYIQGGGVIVYYRPSFKAKLLAKSSISKINETEFIIIELLSDSKQRFLIAVVYRRPEGRVLNSFFNTFFKFQHLYSNVIILGDLNADLLCSEHAPNYYYTLSLKNLINDFGFYNVPFGASHHHSTHDTWLDVILVDDRDKLLSFGKSHTPFINNHDYQIVDYKSKGIINPSKTIRTRDYRNFDSELFKVKLQAELMSSAAFNNNMNINPNVMLDVSSSSALNLLDTYAPFTNRKIKKIVLLGWINFCVIDVSLAISFIRELRL